MAPSKAGSEVGYDSQQGTGVASPTDSNLAKDKAAMTREEREAKYKETRERIFGPESENADSTDAVNEVSRTSSRNEKKKKKPKTNNDDGFTARSQYNAYYPPMPFSPVAYGPSEGTPAYYDPYGTQAQNPVPQAEFMGQSFMPQGFEPNFQSMGAPQSFQGQIAGNPMMSSYGMQGTVGYNQQIPQNYHPHMQQGIGMALGQQSPAMSSPALSNNGQFPGPQSQMAEQQWSHNQYAYPYQQPRDQPQYLPPPMQNQNPMLAMQSVTYPFGQLPLQPNSHGLKAQHPLPGSYKSQAFNPQTRAFVPNNGSNFPPMMHQTHNSNHPMGHTPVTSFQNSNQYSGYNQQAPCYLSMAPMPISSNPSHNHESKNHSTRKTSAQSNATQSPVPNSLSKWGTPAHLPPKPPPPENPSVPEGQHSLPLNNQFNVNLQPINGGQPMPNFHNGVYSMPSANSQTT